MLPKPYIFIFNFAGVLSNPTLDKLAEEVDGQWVHLALNFMHENPHGEQVEATLLEAFDDIMSYARLGIPPSSLSGSEE